MQMSSKLRSLPILLRVPISVKSHRFLLSSDHFYTTHQWQQQQQQQQHSFFSSLSIPPPSGFSILPPAGIAHDNRVYLSADVRPMGHHPLCSMMSRACLTSEATQVNESSTETVRELYLKMLQSVEAETMPPNAWLWSLVQNCANREDIELLFQILQNLRRFRLANLRIHSNFNSHLCLRIAEACARAGALDYGKRALWQHNVYGLTPSIGSAHYLLLHAKEHNNTKLMVGIMKLLKRNSLPLQPGTADIVFSICYNADNWDSISKYAKKFIKEGVKLHRTAFDIWMEFAAKIGDAQSIWKIEELRSKSVKQHTLATGFSCAKGFLLEHKPEDAAAMIHMLNQILPDLKKPLIPAELEKMVSQWPKEVVKRQKKEEDRKALASSLRKDIPAMVDSLLKMGLEVMVDMKILFEKEGIPS
ncbi:uncharacterized protein LOC131231826 [Magnolia sinica]|uniref:uncharacterized protein LOC131231826 n=1 Tax=Magnolia sinica TaxID=86752 RepID=UPI00265B1731|nr:uncharacterized protein LOC131231826 [Magnolia sinica]